MLNASPCRARSDCRGLVVLVRQFWQSGATSTYFSVATYKPYGTAVSPSGTSDKFQYAGEMGVSAAGTSPGLYDIGARWMDAVPT